MPQSRRPGADLPPPALSVVLVIGACRERADRGIDALLNQRLAPPLEIIVVDTAPPPSPPAWAGDARVCYHCAPAAPSIAAAKAAGTRLARAGCIAFLEDHCHASPGWAAAVWRGFEEGADMVAYAFSTENPVNYVSRSFLVLAYGPWMSPVASGWIDRASWMNVAYRAGHLTDRIDELPTLMFCESLFQAGLVRQGARCWQAGDAHVFHRNHPRLAGACRDSAVWQRMYAATRVRLQRFGLAARIVYAAGAPVLAPLLILARLGRAMHRRPGHRRAFWTALPLLVVAYAWGSLHESFGYLFGAGGAERESLLIETADPRSL